MGSVAKARHLRLLRFAAVAAGAMVCGIVLSANAGPAAKTLTLEGYLQRLGYGAIPLERGSQNNLYVKAKLEGKSRSLLVDTGCSLTTLDKGTAGKLRTSKDLGVKLDDPTWEAVAESDRVVIRELQLGPVRFLNQPAHTFALRAQGFSYEGILGCDFLIRNHAILDCAAKRLYVTGDPLSQERGEALKKTLTASGYHPAPLKQSQSLLMTCEGQINGVPVRLAVDTGAVFTTLDDDTANRCKILWEKTGRYLSGVTTGTTATLWSGAPESFELGGARLPVKGMSIGACELQAWKIGGGKAKLNLANGLLGSELLTRCEAVIDYGSQTLWFVPASGESVKTGGR